MHHLSRFFQTVLHLYLIRMTDTQAQQYLSVYVARLLKCLADMQNKDFIISHSVMKCIVSKKLKTNR